MYLCATIESMERGHIISEGEYYHLYNRGVEKRIVFEEDLDYLRFLFSMLIPERAA